MTVLLHFLTIWRPLDAVKIADIVSIAPSEMNASVMSPKDASLSESTQFRRMVH
jgi:hypothetical protein